MRRTVISDEACVVCERGPAMARLSNVSQPTVSRIFAPHRMASQFAFEVLKADVVVERVNRRNSRLA
jgi:hypothetical protein